MTKVVVLKRKPGDVQEVPVAPPVQIAVVANGAPTAVVVGYVLHLKRRIRDPIHRVTRLLQATVLNVVLLPKKAAGAAGHREVGGIAGSMGDEEGERHF